MTLVLRHLHSEADYRACVRLQEETWGEGFSERVPSAILKIAQELGGVSAGAFDAEGRLVGFVFGMTGVRNGAMVHWSDMLAVVPSAAGTGVATALKAFQREAVLAVGVDEMYWTFDPLRARNAYLNLEKLGAVVREYRTDMYGSSDSPLHRGVGTDRFLALWCLESARVQARLAVSLEGHPAAAIATIATRGGDAADDAADDTEEVLPVSSGGPHPVPGDPREGRAAPRITVPVPSDIGVIMDDDPALAVAWRTATRHVFTHYLPRGYEVRGFRRGPVVSHYILDEVGR